eukprot:767922-Hanusia_phi.AAC.4
MSLPSAGPMPGLSVFVLPTPHCTRETLSSRQRPASLEDWQEASEVLSLSHPPYRSHCLAAPMRSW